MNDFGSDLINLIESDETNKKTKTSKDVKSENSLFDWLEAEEDSETSECGGLNEIYVEDKLNWKL